MQKYDKHVQPAEPVWKTRRLEPMSWADESIESAREPKNKTPEQKEKKVS